MKNLKYIAMNIHIFTTKAYFINDKCHKKQKGSIFWFKYFIHLFLTYWCTVLYLLQLFIVQNKISLNSTLNAYKFQSGVYLKIVKILFLGHA